jgi:8-oxo-dGTP diphosphatase
MGRSQITGASNLVPIKDGKVLLSRRFQTGWEDGKYSVVGGHIEEGESPREAAVREGFEEIGIVIKPEDLVLVYQVHRRYSYADRIDFFFALKRWEGDPAIKEPHKCDDLSWFAAGALPQNLVHYVGVALAGINAGQSYSELDYRAEA